MSKYLPTSLWLTAGILSFSVSQPIVGNVQRLESTERLQAVRSLERPLVIAHRGYKMGAPENTIPAFRLGITANSDLIELDYFHSSDGVPVVFHDVTLDRTTNAVELWKEKGLEITSRSLAELRELDAGSWYDPLFAGVGIPTLGEALDAIQPESITLIERKQGDPQTLVDLLTRRKMVNDVIVQAFDWEFLAGCRSLAPEMLLGALGPPRRADGSRYPVSERFLNASFLDRIEATGAAFVGWNRQVTAEAVADAQSRGLQVWVYTINELDEALSLLEMGVNGIISDNPAMVWKAMALYSGGWKQ